jgi:apoptotic chromatin condensation inducer in the nucleus
VSCTIRVDGFVRPFTLPKAQALVVEMGGGPLVDGKGFWMDAIKTHCYATFQKEEHAIKAREALYGLVWPERGGTLKTDFSDKTAAEVAEAAEAARAARLSGGLRAPAAAAAAASSGGGAAVEGKDKGNKGSSNDNNTLLPSSSSNGSLSLSRMTMVADFEEAGIRRKRDLAGAGMGQEAGDKRARLGEEEGRKPRKDVVNEPKFEDLFRATATLPKLYWKTVSEDRVLVKRKRMEEMKAREKERKARR